jgi:hypothetical protein
MEFTALNNLVAMVVTMEHKTIPTHSLAMLTSQL